LDIDKNLKDFVRDHLVDIVVEGESLELVFNKNVDITGFDSYFNFIKQDNNKIYFSISKKEIQNNDPIEALRNVREILRVASKRIKLPHEYYDQLMKLVLTVGAPYTSFVELLLCNMFLTNKKDNKLWRYNQIDPIVWKLGDKTLASKTSPLLGLLYQQNKKAIDSIDFIDQYLNSDNLTIYEKLFLEKF
jgi:hypothetical protein